MPNDRAMVGSLAPEFNLPCTSVAGADRSRAVLADYRGRWLVLMFYPRDFSLVCPTELTALSARLEEFRSQGCELLGISCDSLATHEQWVSTPRARGGVAGLTFPLAADEDGAVARAYGVFLEWQRVAARGIFVIDPNGVLQYSAVHNLSVGRRPDDVLRVIAALQTGGLCASTWDPGDPTLDPSRVLGPGSMISHYRIEAAVGEGTFATVFRARDLTLDRSVALKVLKPGTPMNSSTALAEARAAAALSHPNVCTVFSVDDGEGVPIIAMEFVAGRPLSRILKAGALPVQRAAVVGRQIASGMAAAHAQGVVHGDLKPENIVVDEDDRHATKILDFGLSRRDREVASATADTAVLGVAESKGLYGTPAYMAVEQTYGQPATAASDVFALGAILFEMASGQKAFPGANLIEVVDLIRAVDPGHYASQVDEPLATILSQALAGRPADRTITMREIADRLA